MSGRLRRSGALTRPTASTLVALSIASIAAGAIGVALLFLDFFGQFIVLPFSLATFAAVGLVVAVRRPHHPVGWLFLVAGTCYVVTLASTAYTWHAVVRSPGSLPSGELAAWLTSALWVPAVTCTLLAVALFPDGRPPSTRWWPFFRAAIAALAGTALITAFAPPYLPIPSAFTEGPGSGGTGQIANPFTAPGAIGDLLRAAMPLTEALPVPLFLGVLLSVALRFRRSSGVERQQLKWFAFASSVSIALLTVSLVLPAGAAADVAWVSGMVAWGLVPIGVGIAILRYRLYDIDVVIRRTLVYGVLVVILGAIYVGLVLGLQALLSGVTGGDTLPVALSTLVIAALFGPVSQRVRAVIDRRFYRSRYDAQHTLDEFSAWLRHEVELEAVAGSLVDVARQAVKPASVGVWLRWHGR